MARKTNKAAAIDAADIVSRNLEQLAVIGDLLSATDDSLTSETVPVTGSIIWGLADEARRAMGILGEGGDL